MKEKSIAAKTAKAIRKDLKQRFPNVKFSIRSQTFPLGNAVNVVWTDGPMKQQVRKITGKYQYGEYNIISGTYEINNQRNDIPQVKYINTPCRRMSYAAEDIIINRLYSKYKCCKGKKRYDFIKELNKDMRELIKNEFENVDFTKLHK